MEGLLKILRLGSPVNQQIKKNLALQEKTEQNSIGSRL